MNLSSRHQQILHKLKVNGFVEVTELCEYFDISAVTIRKDLKLLENKGLLFRTHGGAALENPYITDKPVNEKEKIRAAEKERIAIKAATNICENDSILIASGTTVQQLAKQINPSLKLTAVTASLIVAAELIQNANIEVFQLGGNIRHGSSSVIGENAIETLKNTSCNTLFLGADGVAIDFGVSTTSMDEAYLNKQMICSANKTILLVDSSKFGKKSLGKICDLDQIDEIITDSGLNETTKTKLNEIGIKVSVV